MLGHYDAGFTLHTYTHATRQVQNQAAETKGSFMAQVMWAKINKSKGEVPIRTSPSIVGHPIVSQCVDQKNHKDKPAQNILQIKQHPPKSTDFRGFLKLLTRFELVTSSLSTTEFDFF